MQSRAPDPRTRRTMPRPLVTSIALFAGGVVLLGGALLLMPKIVPARTAATPEVERDHSTAVEAPSSIGGGPGNQGAAAIATSTSDEVPTTSEAATVGSIAVAPSASTSARGADVSV